MANYNHNIGDRIQNKNTKQVDVVADRGEYVRDIGYTTAQGHEWYQHEVTNAPAQPVSAPAPARRGIFGRKK